MNIGKESEILEFKKSTAELDKAVCNIASMLNKHGYGTLYFGVLPDGEVKRQPISQDTLNDVAKKISEAIRPLIYPSISRATFDGVDVIRVEFSGQEKPYSAFGRYYKRVHDRTEEMTPSELRKEMFSSDVGSIWENHLTKYGLEDVDHETLRRFYNKAVSCGRLEEVSPYDEGVLLSGLGLFEQGKLTNAGYYLFSNRKPVVLKTAVYVTDERISFSDINRFEDNIYNLIDMSFRFIKDHINWRVEYGGETSRIEIPEIPIEAVRELIVNAFAHADYKGITEHEIDITPSIVEIYNPGEFPTNLSPEMFASEHIKSMPRNRVILNTLYKSKDVEVFGSGFRKVYALCRASGNECKYKSAYGGFYFSLSRQNTGVIRPSTISKGKKTITDSMILDMLKEDPTKTTTQLSEETGKSRRTIQRIINTLSDKGVIRRCGSDKKGYWEIVIDSPNIP